MLATTDQNLPTAPSARPSASSNQSLSDIIDRLIIARDQAAPGFRRRLLCWRLRWYERKVPAFYPAPRVVFVEPELLEEAAA